MQATGVPMAVPICWAHQVSPNWKMLCFITRSRSFMIKQISGFWKGVGRSLLNLLKKARMVGMPLAGSMLGYICSASAVNRRAVEGMLWRD